MKRIKYPTLEKRRLREASVVARRWTAVLLILQTEISLTLPYHILDVKPAEGV